MTLSSLIKKWKFDYVDSDIEKHFTLEEVRSKEYKLFHFDRYISSEDAIKEMAKEGFLPANLAELLSWKEWNEEDCVIALGSVAWVYGDRRVPYLGRDDSERRLSLSWFDRGWNGNYRFLAVKFGSKKDKMIESDYENCKHEVNYCPDCGQKIQ